MASFKQGIDFHLGLSRKALSERTDALEFRVHTSEPEEADTPPQDDSFVCAVFTGIPPELVESDVDPGEVVMVNRAAFDQYSDGPVPCVREATEVEQTEYDARRDLAKRIGRDLDQLSIALLLSAPGGPSLSPGALCGSC